MYAAHIITADARGLGDPEILIMTHDESFGAKLVERIFLPRTSLTDALDLLETRGWQFPHPPAHVQPGYFVIDAIKD